MLLSGVLHPGAYQSNRLIVTMTHDTHAHAPTHAHTRPGRHTDDGLRLQATGNMWAAGMG
jgi:hypothetical protein